MPTRLIYASEACAPLNASAVDDILRNARAKNSRHDITGMLMFDRQAFLQVLEGDRQRLSELYVSLARDDRHRRLALLQCGPVDERLFAAWHMGFMAADAAHCRLLLRYTASSLFEPHRLTAAAALSLLQAVAQGAPEQPCALALRDAA